MTPTRCISIRQPWAWMILNAGKDVENRTWPTNFRGPVYVHATKGMTRHEYDMARLFMIRKGRRIEVPPHWSLERGGIVGMVEVVGCEMYGKCDSPWAMFGGYCFKLRNPVNLPFTPCAGRLGFFKLPEGVVAPMP